MPKQLSDAAFADFLRPELVAGLRSVNIFAPNVIQANAIPLALSGRDLMVSISPLGIIFNYLFI